MQFVKLATTCVTSPAASHASLVQLLCMKLNWSPRKSLDWMLAATRAHWLKNEELRARRLTGWKKFQ